jgi:hypothetical protein
MDWGGTMKWSKCCLAIAMAASAIACEEEASSAGTYGSLNQTERRDLCAELNTKFADISSEAARLDCTSAAAADTTTKAECESARDSCLAEQNGTDVLDCSQELSEACTSVKVSVLRSCYTAMSGVLRTQASSLVCDPDTYQGFEAPSECDSISDACFDALFANKG